MIDTQIRTVLVPEATWNARGLPQSRGATLAELAHDATDIERRSRKGVNIRGENRRYAQLCRRIQELSLPALGEDEQHTRYWHGAGHDSGPYALSFLAVSSLLVRWLRKNSKLADVREKSRIAKCFNPPQLVDVDVGLFAALSNSKSLDGMLEQAASNEFARISSVVTPESCREALLQRYAMLDTARSSSCGVVDIVL